MFACLTYLPTQKLCDDKKDEIKKKNVNMFPLLNVGKKIIQLWNCALNDLVLAFEMSDH